MASEMPADLTQDRDDASYNPAWTKDGGTLIFTGEVGSQAMSLFRISRSPLVIEGLVDDEDHDYVNLPGNIMCEDDDSIVISSDRGGHDDIWIMGLATGEFTQVTDDDAQDWEPSWSPDCEWIVFQSDRDGNWNIYKIKRDGTSLTQLTDGEGDEEEPNWSNKDSRIVYQSNEDGKWGLYLMHADGTHVVKLTPDDMEATDPSWSPDDSKIAFSGDSAETDSEDIMIVDVDTKEISQFVSWPGYEGAPSWAPDNNCIAFESDRGGKMDIWLMHR
jgi:TolB protein